MNMNIVYIVATEHNECKTIAQNIQNAVAQPYTLIEVFRTYYME